MIKSERYNYSKLLFWWTEPSPWEEKAKITLEIPVFLDLAHAEQVFGGLALSVCSPSLLQTRCYPAHLQAAENGKEIVKCHDVAVDCHEPQQPRGADEQQEQERCPQHRAVKQTQTDICSVVGYKRTTQLLPVDVPNNMATGKAGIFPLGKLGQCSPTPSFQLSHTSTPLLNMFMLKSDFFPS